MTELRSTENSLISTSTSSALSSTSSVTYLLLLRHLAPMFGRHTTVWSSSWTSPGTVPIFHCPRLLHFNVTNLLTIFLTLTLPLLSNDIISKFFTSGGISEGETCRGNFRPLKTHAHKGRVEYGTCDNERYGEPICSSLSVFEWTVPTERRIICIRRSFQLLPKRTHAVCLIIIN